MSAGSFESCLLILLAMSSFLLVQAVEPYDSSEKACDQNGEASEEGAPKSAYGIPIEKLHHPISAKSQLCLNVTVSETDIARDIFRRHYSWERPLKDARKPIDIEIRLVLQSISDVIEKDKLVKLTGYLLIYWWDEYHVWNTTFPHACLDSVVMHHSEVWIPDLAVTNSQQHYELLLMYEQERVRKYSSGWTSYKPGGTFGVFCDFDLTYFPFDEQNCVINLESWRYTMEYQIFHFGDTVQLRYWIENEQWFLLNTSQHIGMARYVTTNQYAQVQFGLKLKRKIAYYLVNVIIPSVIISVAQIATFTLPVGEVLKIHISITCLLAYGVFQLMIIEDIPRTSDRMPLLSYYIALSMAYICLAMLGEGVVFICIRKGADKRHKHHVSDAIYRWTCLMATLLRIEKPLDLIAKDRHLKMSDEPATTDHRHNQQQIQEREREMMKKYVSFVAFPKLQQPENNNEHQEVESAANNNNNNNCKIDDESIRKHRWDFLADVVDRLVFVSYMLIICLTPVVMFVIVPKSDETF